jgi:hypothetical protein
MAPSGLMQALDRAAADDRIALARRRTPDD